MQKNRHVMKRDRQTNTLKTAWSKFRAIQRVNSVLNNKNSRLRREIHEQKLSTQSNVDELV